MAKTSKLVGLTVAALIGGTLAAPAQAGAQTVPMCGGQPATIIGTAGSDFLEGTSGNDVIFGAQGDDTIFGFGGDDIICAGQGNDVVIGGQGFDILFGAQGDDVLFAADGSSEADRKDVRGARIFGGAGDDLIVGSDRWDRMQGGQGIDSLAGYEGRDWMRGGGDGDFLDGGANIDDMHGGNGADRMRATTDDIVRGSNGNDLCELNGTPAMLLSCSENSQAFAPARSLPVMPPTRSGLDQAVDYQTTVLNERRRQSYGEIWIPGCEDVPATVDDWHSAIDDILTDGWHAEFSIGEVDAMVERVALAENKIRYTNAVGQEITTYTQDEVYLYIDGAWRAGNC